MTFQHKPLPRGSNAFRLLELQPGTSRDEIRCSLRIYAFPPSADITYEPISYCWGDPRIKESITVDGCRADITRSLYMALVRLRLEDRPRLLWADAICINQDDCVEKNDQVQMMRDIYRCGHRTLAWLGEGSRLLTRRGFSFITAIQESQRRHQKAKSFPDSLFLIGNKLALQSRFNDFLALFEEPYFSRAWIMQEIAVSPSIEILSSNQAVSWDILNDVLDHLSESVMIDWKIIRSLGNFNSISLARSNFQGGVKQNLLQALSDHRRTTASIPKDKVYAFLGLVDTEDLRKYSIMPNYSNDYTVGDVYIDIACSILRSNASLDLLSEPRCTLSASACQLVPTWVPEWNIPPASIPLIDFSQTTSLAATGSSICRPMFRDNQRMVVLVGYVFDEIGQVGCPFPERPKPFIAERKRSVVLFHTFSSNWQEWDFNAQMLRAWKNWRHLFSNHYSQAQRPSEISPEIFLWKMMTTGYQFLPDIGEPEAHREWEFNVGKTRGPLGIFDRRLIWRAYIIARCIYIHTATKHPSLLDAELFECCYGRTAFVSRDGRFGLGPQNMHPGDSLAFLEGGKVPYILRRKGDVYEFVGDCYIYGIMQGELFDESKSGQICLV